MKATIVTGPYGVGKTTTINRLYPQIKRMEGRPKIIVSESSAIGLDASRYEGVPKEDIDFLAFGTVCCPNEELLQQAIGNSIRAARQSGKYGHLIIEPSGNLDSRRVVDALFANDVQSPAVATLLNRRSLDASLADSVVQSAISTSTVIGVSKREGNEPLITPKLDDFLRTSGVKSPVVEVNRGNLSYDVLTAAMRDQPQFLPLMPGRHDVHYNQRLIVINPNLGRQELTSLLEQLASEELDRAKGFSPQAKIEFNLEGSRLDITDYKGKGMVAGQLFVAAKRDLPGSLLDKFGYKPGSKDDIATTDSTPEQMVALFSHLYGQTEHFSPVTQNGNVVSHFDNVDRAFLLAREIASRHGDYNPFRQALVPKIQSRLDAMYALDSSDQPDKVLVGLDVGSQLMLLLRPGEVDPSFIEPNQQNEIRRSANPYFGYLAVLEVSDARSFPDYDVKVGAKLLERAKIGKPYVSDKSLLQKVSENMYSVNMALGRQDLANSWRDLPNGESAK